MNDTFPASFLPFSLLVCFFPLRVKSGRALETPRPLREEPGWKLAQKRGTDETLWKLPCDDSKSEKPKSRQPNALGCIVQTIALACLAVVANLQES